MRRGDASVEFEAVPTERAVEIMRAWALHRWPMTVDEGVGVYTGLGFTPRPGDRTFFTSDMSPREADSFLVVEGDLVGEVSLRLSNWVPEEDWERSLPKSRAAFDECVRAYTEVLGEPFSFEDEGTDFSRRWILDTKVMVELAGNEAFVELSVDSPEGTGDFLRELEMEERGEPIDQDYF
ncbi:DUF6301 family protein [Schaalia georgiae]|uniref:DUF6301 family protein n=1 Tax=Schaalia georgiae TaxID=52768 RepID=UPI0003F6276D|nr:DUF6301 family protein [Schaalia georgiae]